MGERPEKFPGWDDNPPAWFDKFGPMSEAQTLRVGLLCVCAEFPDVAARIAADPEGQWASTYAYMHTETTEYGGAFREWVLAHGGLASPPHPHHDRVAAVAAAMVAHERGVDVAAIVGAVAAGDDAEYLGRIIRAGQQTQRINGGNDHAAGKDEALAP